jgi:hypothetical protein
MVYDEDLLKEAIHKWYGSKYSANPHVDNMNLRGLKKFIEKNNIPIFELHLEYNYLLYREVDDYEGMITFQKRLMRENPNMDQTPMLDDIKDLEKHIDKLFTKTKDITILELPDSYFFKEKIINNKNKKNKKRKRSERIYKSFNDFITIELFGEPDI